MGRESQVDEAKVAQDARYDGKWVLRTNTDLDSAEVALLRLTANKDWNSLRPGFRS